MRGVACIGTFALTVLGCEGGSDNASSGGAGRRGEAAAAGTTTAADRAIPGGGMGGIGGTGGLGTSAMGGIGSGGVSSVTGGTAGTGGFATGGAAGIEAGVAGAGGLAGTGGLDAGSSGAGSGGLAGAGGIAGTGGAEAGVGIDAAPGICGDGIVQSGEFCDDGDRYDGDPCQNDCTVNLCGNDVVDPGETCDVSTFASTADRCAYLSGNCGPIASCVSFRWWDSLNCHKHCEAYTNLVAGDDDHCCPPGATSDPDCPSAYPFTKSYQLSAPANATSLQFGQNGDPPEIYIPLAPGSCGPIVMTSRIVNDNFLSGYYDSILKMYPWYSGEDTAPATLSIEMGPADFTPRPALFAVDRENAVLTGLYDLTYCLSGNCDSMGTNPQGTLELRFGEFLGDPIAPAAAAPSQPRIMGNLDTLFVAYRDVVVGADRVQLTAGQFTGPYSYYMAEPRWQAAFAPVSLSTAGATLDGPELTYLADTMGIAAHVVWVENGTTLMHAKVNEAGAAIGVQGLYTGAALAEPRIVNLTQTTAVVAFTENVGGTRRLRGLIVDNAGTVVAPVADLSDSSGDVLEPDLAPVGLYLWTAVWIDQRSGAREVYFRRFTAGTLTPSIASLRLDPSAVNPTGPRVVQWGSVAQVLWTDQRDGYRAIYGTGTVSSAADEPSLRVSPAGEDSHDVSIERKHSEPVGYTPWPALTHVSWHEGTAGDQVRFARVATSTSGAILQPPVILSLACETANTSSLAMADTGSFQYYNSQKTSPRSDAISHGVWVQNGALVAQSLPQAFVSRSPATCTPGEFLCMSEREVHVCHADGYGTTLLEYCPWPESCNATTGTCACVPGPVCDGTIATTCTTAGTYASGGTDCAALGLSCVDGACVTPIFSENFDDGDYAGWIRGAYPVERIMDSTITANGTAYSLFERGGGADAVDGLYQEFPAVRPNRISWWMRSENPTYQTTAVHFSGVEGDFIVEIANQQVTNGTMGFYPAQNGQWYFIELRNFDWDAQTYDFYVDGALIQAGASTNGASSLRRMTLVVGNVNSTSRGWWDEIIVE